jgi:hypothetical protein
LQRPAAPAKNRGRLQRRAKVALWWRDGTITTAQAAQWTHALRLHQGKRMRSGDYANVRRVLAAIADPVSRAGGRGRPILWRARNMDDARLQRR